MSARTSSELVRTMVRFALFASFCSAGLALTQKCKITDAAVLGTTHCEKNVSLVSNTKASLVCVHNPPLGASVLLSGQLLRLFDREVFTVEGEHLSKSVKISYASEDTSLAGMTGITTNETAQEQVLRQFRANSSDVWDSVARLRSSVHAFWGGDVSNSASIAVSPFGSACIGLKAFSTRGAGTVIVKVRREGPTGRTLRSFVTNLANGQDGSADGSSGGGGGDWHLWIGPAMLLFGAMLFAHAGTLASSVTFHYASCVSLFMALSVLLLLAIVFQRTGTRGRMFAATLMTAMGVTLSAMRDSLLEYGRSHWPMVLAWLAGFALLGYGITYWRLKGGGPEAYETAMLAGSMRLLSLLLIFYSSHSLRASVSLLLASLMLYGAPGSAPLSKSLSWLSKGRRSGSAAGSNSPMPPMGADKYRDASGRPAKFVDDYGDERTWVPPTPTGRYLTQEGYEMQGQIATGYALDELFSSPEYAKWFRENHHRISVGQNEDMRQPGFEDDDDDELGGEDDDEDQS